MYDPLISKRQQYLLATQVRTYVFVLFFSSLELRFSQLVRAVLKIGQSSAFSNSGHHTNVSSIDDVIISGQAE